jgi:hypothetical protein
MASRGTICTRNVKTGAGVHAILWFYLRPFRGCNVGITDGNNLLITPLKLESSATIFIPSFINIGSGIQKLIGEIQTDTERETHTQKGDLVSLL